MKGGGGPSLPWQPLGKDSDVIQYEDRLYFELN